MEKIPVDELARRLDEILSRVSRGEHFTITDRGRPAAELGPAGEARSARRPSPFAGDPLDSAPSRAQTARDAILDIQKRVKPLGIPVRDAIEDGRM